MSAREVLISFDIGGTLKGYGGPITVKHIKKAKENAIVGGGSSRSVRSQRIVWHELGIKPEFLVFKNNLHRLPERYPEIKKFFHVDDLVLKIQRFTILRPREFIKDVQKFTYGGRNES